MTYITEIIKDIWLNVNSKLFILPMSAYLFIITRVLYSLAYAPPPHQSPVNQLHFIADLPGSQPPYLVANDQLNVLFTLSLR